MKIPFLLAGALLLSAPVFAQPRPKSTYDLLAEAGTKILPGPNGGASNTDPTISPGENLKRERLAVARNAPALALVRQALALQQPTGTLPSPFDITDIDNFSFNARMRELARQFSQESDVRFADGDFVGALNSKLDTMELGALIGRGSLIGELVGLAVEAIGLKNAEKAASHLDETACREAVARLEHIEARRATLSQVLRDEQQSSLKFETQILANIKTKAGDDEDPQAAQDNAQLKTLSVEQLTSDNTRLFDALVQNAALPYSNTAPILPPASTLNPLTRGHLLWARNGSYRFNWGRIIASSRLLRAALELRAIRLESGAFPATFGAPADPFAPDLKPLVYKRTARDYLLYSVGPDGKDDGGSEIQTVEAKGEPPITTVSDRLAFNSTGDIVQTPF